MVLVPIMYNFIQCFVTIKYKLYWYKTSSLLNIWSDLDPSVLKTDCSIIIFEITPSAKTLIIYIFSINLSFTKGN